MKKLLFYIAFTVYIAGLLLMGSCSDEMDVRTDYEFTVTHLPVPKRLKCGETAEIRLELVRSGSYDNTKYYVRFFQSDGKGELTLDGRTLEPNDGYEIKKETFRMYYTSLCEERQVIDLVFFDSNKNQVELSFNFANDTEEK